jgi:DNA repair exonuclease SbcCD ATPase subunit
MNDFKEINKSLAELQDHLSRLKTSTDSIETADAVARSSAKITKELTELSDSLIRTYKVETDRLTEMDIPGNFAKIKTVIEKVQDDIEQFDLVVKSYIQTSENKIAEIYKKISELNEELEKYPSFFSDLALKMDRIDKENSDRINKLSNNNNIQNVVIIIMLVVTIALIIKMMV